jgi:antitoxin VapB
MAARTAKLFKTGGSQAVRLPAAFRLPGNEVSIRRDERTGEVVLTPIDPRIKPYETLAAFNEAFKDVAMPEDFMSDRPLNRSIARKDPFSHWDDESN